MVIASAAVVAYGVDAIFPNLDYRILDPVLALKVAAGDKADRSDSTILIAVDYPSERSLGDLSGTNLRYHLPALLDVLVVAGAGVVVFDFEFSSPVPEVDNAFRDAIVRHGSVISARGLDSVPNLYFRDAFLAVGGFNVADPGGVPRYLPADRTGDEPIPISLLAAAESGFTGIERPMWIDYSNPISHFLRFSLAEVIENDGSRLADSKRTPLSVFDNRTVFVGRDVPTIDQYSFPHTLGRKYAGVYGHIYAFETAISGTALKVPPPNIRLLLNGASMLLSLAIVTIRRGGRLIAIGLSAIWFVAASAYFIGARFVAPVFPPVLGILAAVLAYRLIDQIEIRQNLRSAIGFDPSVLAKFRTLADKSESKSIQQPVCILCSDIRSYTSFVLSTDHDVVTSAMSAYLGEMERIIVDHGGYVNKYIGDEIVAVFGFPYDREHPCDDGIEAGREMLQTVERMVGRWKSEGQPHFDRIGIGVDFGVVSFLEVGGNSKRQFDIIGNAMNGAARLQELTKKDLHPFFVSQEVITELPGNGVDESMGDFPNHPDFEIIGSYPIRGQGDRIVYRDRRRDDPSNPDSAIE